MVQLGHDAEQKSLSVTLDVVGLGPVKCEAAVSDSIYDGLLNVGFLNEIVLTADIASRKAWARRHDGPGSSK
jgi:hypothetical protein